MEAIWDQLDPVIEHLKACDLNDAEATQAVTEGQATIAFLPDGTATAAAVWIADDATGEAETIVLVIDGLTGRVRLMQPAALLEEQAEGWQ